MIGDDVTMTVLAITGNQVRIGIDAPREVEVHRDEIYHKVKKERGNNEAFENRGNK